MNFAPTEYSRANLLREGIPEKQILVTGNTVIDALQAITKTDAPLQVQGWLKEWGIDANGKQLILVTAHRRENFGEPIRQICEALRILAQKYAETVHFVYPVHLNPNIQEPVHELLGNVAGISLVEPVDYISLVHLMKAAAFVMTDSGGIQEEAAGLGKPTLVLREVTERPEGVEAGVLKLVGADVATIVREASRLLDEPTAYAAMAKASNVFGDGHAAGRIVEALLHYQQQS